MTWTRRFAISLLAVLLLLVPTASSADAFQFLYETEDDTYYVRDGRVEVFGDDGNKLFTGRTDKYGRIRIDLDPGTYPGQVRYRNSDWQVKLTLDGERNLKKVTIN